MVREGRQYEELRYALRSLANLPHDRVWVYGGRPGWLTNATHIPVRQGPVAHVNTARITAAIANERGLSDQFCWFHDDMFVLHPIAEVPRLYRCGWAEWVAAAKDRKGPHGVEKTQATVRLLEHFGIAGRYSYELHVPMIVERDALREMVAKVTAYQPECLTFVQKRSLYGNWAEYGGRLAPDVKFRQDAGTLTGPFASSSDTALNGPAGQRLRAMFPEPSPYERQTPVNDADRLMAGHLGVQ